MSSDPSATEAGAASPPGRRYVVSMLDPRTAPRRPGQRQPGRTLYFADRLIVSDDLEGADARTGLLSSGAPPRTVHHALAELGFALDDPEQDGAAPNAARPLFDARPGEASSHPGARSLVLRSTSESATAPPDAWTVLDQLREKDPELAKRVSLDHVIRPCGGYWDGVGGYWDGVGGYWDGIGDEDPNGGYWPGVGGYWPGVGNPIAAEYRVPGKGGRMPVSVVLDDPSRSVQELERHPVVAIPDSGIGPHPWFPTEARWKNDRPKILRRAGIGLPQEADAVARPNPFTGQVGRLVGHGTFIAGVVRQGCPQATLFPIPVMDEIGAAAEDDILAALRQVRDLHVRAQAQRAAGGPKGSEEDVRDYVIDILSLSIGFYPEGDEDDDDTIDHDDAEDLRALTTGPVGRLLTELGEVGILVVAGVGNDASTSKFIPAALAPKIDLADGSAPRDEASGRTKGLPIVSVGALNPGSGSIAMFTNTAGHITAYRPGVSVVSTLPTRNTGSQSVLTAPGNDDLPRATVDSDDYTDGFGVWSGTSFAAPAFAAAIATELAKGGGSLTDTSPEAMRARGWRALKSVLAADHAKAVARQNGNRATAGGRDES